jgi:hypothetical protein
MARIKSLLDRGRDVKASGCSNFAARAPRNCRTLSAFRGGFGRFFREPNNSMQRTWPEKADRLRRRQPIAREIGCADPPQTRAAHQRRHQPRNAARCRINAVTPLRDRLAGIEEMGRRYNAG